MVQDPVQASNKYRIMLACVCPPLQLALCVLLDLAKGRHALAEWME